MVAAMNKKNQKLHSKMKKNSIKFTAETDKMAGRSVISKKMCELESELAGIIRDPTSSGTRLQIPFYEINQRFVFLGNLIQQEMASGQLRDSDELLEMKRRFTALQTGFLRWNESRHSVCSDCTQNLLRGEDGELPGEMKLLKDSSADEMIVSKRDASTQVVPYDDDVIESSSNPTSIPGEFFSEMKLLRDSPADEVIASKRDASTQVVPYDDDIIESSSDSTSIPGEFSGEEKKPDKFLNGVEKKMNLINEEVVAAVTEDNLWGKMAKYGGAFGCGMIVGAVVMAKLFFISYSSVDFIPYEALLLPPT